MILLLWKGGIYPPRLRRAGEMDGCLIVDVPSKDLVLHNTAAAGLLFYNQSIRAINSGKTPDEMAAEIRLPKHLDQHSALFPSYIDNEYNMRAQYRGNVGWFDEDISELHPPLRDELAQSLIGLSGGSEALVGAAEKAFGEKKYNLAVKLYSIVIDGESKNAKALRQMAYTTRAGIQTRNFLLTHALDLEGKVDMSKPPSFLFLGSASVAEIMASPFGSSSRCSEHSITSVFDCGAEGRE